MGVHRLVCYFFCLIALSCSAGDPAIDASDAATTEDNAVIPIIEDSPSLVLRAHHVLTVQVDDARVGDWSQPDPTTGLAQRLVDLDVTLESVIKGEVTQEPGDQFTVRIGQFGTGTGRVFALPGAWSATSPTPGTKLVVFTHQPGTDARALLPDPAPERVEELSAAMPDLELIAHAERENHDLAALIAAAKPHAGELHSIFGEYVWARHGAAALGDPQAFDLVSQFVEQPGLALQCRAVLLDAVDAEVSVSDTASDWHVGRHAITLFRLLTVPEAAALHDEIISPLLPNLLRLDGQPRFDAATLFQGHADARQAAMHAVAAYSGEEDTSPIQAWLSR